MRVLEGVAVAGGVSVDDVDIAGWQAESEDVIARVAGRFGGCSRGWRAAPIWRVAVWAGAQERLVAG